VHLHGRSRILRGDVLRLLAGGDPVTASQVFIYGLEIVGAIYCIAALIRMAGGM